MRSSRKVMLRAGISLALALGLVGVSEAQCNFQGNAAASVTAHDGGVVSEHFGQITNVECSLHSRKMLLRANTLKDNVQVWKEDKEGAEANLGASVFYSLGFPTCDGQWSSGSLFGTTLLGVLVGWLDSGVSGLTQGYCLPDGPGGDDGPDFCSSAATETTTTALTAEGTDAGAERDSGIGLTRSVERPEGRFLSEEWAVLSSDSGTFRVEFASSDRFLAHVEGMADLYERLGRGNSTVLVVEWAAHPRNHRFIPTPDLKPLEVSVDWPSRTGRAEFWFRAEVAKGGEIDRLLFLDSSDGTGATAVRPALERGLELQYETTERHRVVVFGRALVSPGGRLTVRESLVLVPKCCCGVDEVICI